MSDAATCLELITCPEVSGQDIHFQTILEHIAEEVKPLLTQGKVANYIPALAHVNPDNFAMAVSTIKGQEYQVGEADTLFSIQSISKALTLILALQQHPTEIWSRVGRETSNNAFNSIIQLEQNHGIPRNPLINAGALVVADYLISNFGNAKNSILQFIKGLSGNASLQYDFEIAESEKKHGHRNAALTNFMKSYGNINNEVEQVLDTYFHQCAIAMSCSDLARTTLFLANQGVDPGTGQRIISADQTKKINSILLTCGMYDAVGEFSYRVGLPAKSGVGGGIVAIIPGQMSICVWSPGLDGNGNSLAGIAALEAFVRKTGYSIF